MRIPLPSARFGIQRLQREEGGAQGSGSQDSCCQKEVNRSPWGAAGPLVPPGASSQVDGKTAKATITDECNLIRNKEVSNALRINNNIAAINSRRRLNANKPGPEHPPGAGCRPGSG